MSNRNMRMLS